MSERPVPARYGRIGVTAGLERCDSCDLFASIHRTPEKSEIFCVLAFDRSKSPPYIRRPRRLRHTPPRTTFRSERKRFLDRFLPGWRLFEIVIEGRGTWAAARLPSRRTKSSALLNQASRLKLTFLFAIHVRCSVGRLACDGTDNQSNLVKCVMRTRERERSVLRLLRIIT